MRRPLISVVIYAFNCRPTLGLILHALETQRFDKSAFDCVVVDDGSTDDTLAFLAATKWDISLSTVSNPTMLGRSLSLNRGWNFAKGHLIAFLAGDMIPVQGWLESYCPLFENNSISVASGVSCCLAVKHHHNTALNTWTRGIHLDTLDTLWEHFAPQPVLSGDLPYRCKCTLAWRQAFERHARSYCPSHVQNLSWLPSINSANVMMTREILNSSGGFAPLLGEGAAFDLSFRIAQQHGTFAVTESAVTYHLAPIGMSFPEWSDSDRCGFLYRNPTQLALAICLLYSSDSLDRPLSSPPIACESASSAWERVCTEVDPHLIPGTFDYLANDLVRYFSEISGLDESAVYCYIADALANGLLIRRSHNTTYFDLYHTSNWLRTNTLYQDHCLKHAAYGRTHPTPRQCDVEAEEFVKLHCRGTYTMTLDMDGLVFDDAYVNVSLPVNHSCQRNLAISRFVPDSLTDYIRGNREVLTRIPASLVAEHGGQISYEFECDIVEGRFPRVGRDNASTLHYAPMAGAPLQVFGFPPRYLDKTKALLGLILNGGHADPETDVRRIFQWILDNLSYANTPLQDHLILDTGVGTCVQLARLFGNLVQLRGLPVREQCGALMVREVSDCETETISREYSPFAHTWSEVYLEPGGWYPVEFIAMRYGQWETTSSNVTEGLRAEMAAQTPQLIRYYCGNVDPYRVYANSYANRIPPVSLGGSQKSEGRSRDLLSRVQHRLRCSFSHSTSLWL
jgi:hypothetical protein